MRSLRVDREVQRRIARRADGLSPLGSRLLMPQVIAAPLEREILQLPVEVEGVEPIQNADGSFKFTWSFSSWGGEDTHSV